MTRKSKFAVLVPAVFLAAGIVAKADVKVQGWWDQYLQNPSWTVVNWKPVDWAALNDCPRSTPEADAECHNQELGGVGSDYVAQAKADRTQILENSGNPFARDGDGGDLPTNATSTEGETMPPETFERADPGRAGETN